MDGPNWLETPALLYVLMADGGTKAAAVRRAVLNLPLWAREHVGRAYYHPYEEYAHLSMVGHDKSAWDAAEEAVERVGIPAVLAEAQPPPRQHEEPWLLAKAGAALQPVAEAMNLLPNPVNRLWGGPSPLAATLTGGLLGAGLGWAGGTLAEQFLPEQYFEKGRLRRALALLGGMGGATPGLAWGGLSMGANEEAPGMGAWVHGWPFRDQDREKTSCVAEAYAGLCEALGHEKQSFYGLAGGMGGPPIEVDDFNRIVWRDPNTPMPIRAATTGLMESASMMHGGANLVSPMDVGRIAVGMGSGWASGMLVGKALGALAGLREESQQKLQEAGVWAGLLSNVVPMAFRGS